MILKGLSESQFDKCWKISRKTRSVQSGAFLKALANQVSLSVDSSSELDLNALDSRIKENFKGKSVLATIETICHEVGCHPVYPDLKTERAYKSHLIHFKKGVRKFPYVTAGPFLIEVVEFSEDFRNGTAILSLVARSFGMPREAMLYEWAGSVVHSPLDIHSILGVNGKNLLDKNGPSGKIIPSVTQNACADKRKFQLKGITKSATAISVSGRTLFPLATKLETKNWDNFHTIPTIKIGSATVSIKSISTSLDSSTGMEKTSICFVIEAVPAHRIQFTPFGQNDNLIPFVRGSGIGSNQSIFCYGDVKVLRVQHVVEEAELIYPFELKIPVNSKQQVQSLKVQVREPNANFVDLKIVKQSSAIKRKNPVVQISNNTNIDMRKCIFFVNYFQNDQEFLDSDGVTLDDFDEVALKWNKVVPAGESIEHYLNDFDHSPSISSFQIELYEVEFMNGETWRPQK